jgi:beta-glucosidase
MPLYAAQSWDEELIEMMGNITAYEMRYAGPFWNFAPIMCIGRELRWGRVGETFGEDPYLLGRVGAAIVRGFQGHNGVSSDPDRILACAKHFAGYSETMGGRDASEGENSERKLRSFFLPPFEAVIKEGKVGSVMIAYNGLDGTPACSNEWLLRQVLREEWKFPGFALTDWNDVGQLVDQHVVHNLEEAAALSVKAGTDVSMTCRGFYQNCLNAIQSGKLDLKYVNDAVRRQLEIKFRLGLFEDPRHPDSEKAKARANSDFSRAQVQKLAEESVVLLKNDGILPYDKHGLMKVSVIGPNAEHAVQQNAGGNPARDKFITIYDGIRKAFPNVEYQKGCGIEPGETGDLEAAIAAVKAADASIVVIGDRPRFYWERNSMATLELMGGQLELLGAVIATKKKFTLVVYYRRSLLLFQNMCAMQRQPLFGNSAHAIWEDAPLLGFLMVKLILVVD